MIALSFFCSGVNSFLGTSCFETSLFCSVSVLLNSPRSNSSTETPSVSARIDRFDRSGLPEPDSHFEIVLFERYNLSANCCCVKPCCFLNSAINFPVCLLSIVNSPNSNSSNSIFDHTISWNILYTINATAGYSYLIMPASVRPLAASSRPSPLSRRPCRLPRRWRGRSPSRGRTHAPDGCPRCSGRRS